MNREDAEKVREVLAERARLREVADPNDVLRVETYNPTPHVCQFCDRPIHDGVCNEEAVTFYENFHRALKRSNDTPRRTIRIADGLWMAAQARAEERGESLSNVIRKALVRYVRRR